MLDKFFNIFKRWSVGAEREPDEKLDEKIDNLDDRIEDLETSQVKQDEKLLSIRKTALENRAKLGELESKLPQLIREIVEIRIEVFQQSLKNIQILLSKALNNYKK